MKKILSVFLLSMVAFIAINANVQAADGDIELYPYDQEACLIGTVDCTRTKLGDANWDISYNGYNYNVVRGNARYVVDFDDLNSDGMYDVTEYPGASWSSFGGVFINDTASEAIISTINLRGDTSNGSTPRIWVYYDENGDVAMFEDNYINKYDIFNEGDAATPDWRFATTAEMDVLTAAELVVSDAEIALSTEEAALAALTAGTPEHDAQLLVVATAQGVVDAAELALEPIALVTIAQSLIRIKTDAVDTDGYVLEPLASLKWIKADADITDGDVTNDSDIIADNPDYVVIPAGWTVFYFGYLDRSGDNQKTLDYTATFPEAMIAGDTAPMEAVYTSQPGWFTGLSALDDDLVTAGVQVIVDYNGSFFMPTTVVAEWLAMFDGSDMIQNMEEPLDFFVEISDDSGVLETIDYTWNATTVMYDLSAEQTVIDSSMFGAGYLARFEATTPEGDMNEFTVEIAVGVLPPVFGGVEDRYADEDVMVDLLGDITADDGYGNDLTDSIMISYPTELNPYNPQPGMYQIDLEFVHKFTFEAPQSTITIDGVTTDWDDASFNSITSHGDATTNYAIFTDSTMAQDVTWAWGSVMVLVGADGLVDGIYDRYTWDVDDETGAWNDGGTTFTTWKDNLAIEAGGFAILSHGSTISPPLRALAYDSPISFYHSGLDLITIDGASLEWDATMLNSVTIHGDATNDYAIFTIDSFAHDVTWAWGSVMVLVGADGLVDGIYDRYTWDVDDETGAWNDGGTTFETWKAGIAIEDGGFVILSHGSNISPALRALTYDSPISYYIGLHDLDIDIITQDSYNLTIDDLTVPTALVVSEEYMIEAGAYANIDDAILANVVALDNYDMPEDLAIYVSDNGGLMLDTVGTYTVEVTVEDMTGNATMVEFDVMVVAAPVILTDAEVQALIDAAVEAAVDGLLDEAAVDAIVDAAVSDALTDADVQALIDAALAVEEDTGCGSSLAIGSSLVGLFALFGGAGLFFIRKRK